MELFESSPYVKERVKKLAPYFAKRGWFIAAGINNTILINIGEKEKSFSAEELAQIIIEADQHVQETGLPVNDINYEFYFKAKLHNSFIIVDPRDFDVWDESPGG